MASRLAAAHRARFRTARPFISVLLLGFASGIPLSLTGYAMQAWLTAEGVPLATIGILSLVGLPYTLKFLWAPLLDSFDLPFFGRRRGWVFATQLMLAAVLLTITRVSPIEHIKWFAVLALLVSFLSASQDIVVDAYRIEVLPPEMLGLGSSLFMLGYRLAMLLSGGLTLVWADEVLGNGWSWVHIYQTMANLMAALALLSIIAMPSLKLMAKARDSVWRDLFGFLAIALMAAIGWVVSERLVQPTLALWFHTWQANNATPMSLESGMAARWINLAGVLFTMVLTAPLIVITAKAARFTPLVQGLNNYFSRSGAWIFLCLIVVYRLGDALAGALLTPFLLKEMSFTTAEVGVVTSFLGLWLGFLGSILGGAWMLRLCLWRALLIFGTLKAVTLLGYVWLANVGKGHIPGFTLPAFDIGLVRLSQPTALDGSLILVYALDSICNGMVTIAFTSLLMSLCSRRFAATQFALLSALATLGRIWVGPMAGVLAEGIGWQALFFVSAVLALPGIWLLWLLRERIILLKLAEPVCEAS